MKQRIIATWNPDQNVDTDYPERVRIITLDEDGHVVKSVRCSPEVFARVNTATQGDPSIEYDAEGNEESVSFGYAFPV